MICSDSCHHFPILCFQSQIDDKDRTIKIQQNQIDKLEKDVVKLASGTEPQLAQNVDTNNIATQTERVSSIIRACIS